MNTGWYRRRRDLLRHLESGRISLLDSAIHDFLCLTCDYRTGVAWCSAAKIRALCPAEFSDKAIKRSLQKLERIGWIKRFIKRGRRGNYPVVISRFFVRDASRNGWMVNAERTTDWRHVQFDAVPDSGPEADPERVRELSPIQEVRIKKIEQETPTARPAARPPDGPEEVGAEPAGYCEHCGGGLDSPEELRQHEASCEYAQVKPSTRPQRRMRAALSARLTVPKCEKAAR